MDLTVCHLIWTAAHGLDGIYLGKKTFSGPPDAKFDSNHCDLPAPLRMHGTGHVLLTRPVKLGASVSLRSPIEPET